MKLADLFEVPPQAVTRAGAFAIGVAFGLGAVVSLGLIPQDLLTRVSIAASAAATLALAVFAYETNRGVRDQRQRETDRSDTETRAIAADLDTGATELLRGWPQPGAGYDAVRFKLERMRPQVFNLSLAASRASEQVRADAEMAIASYRLAMAAVSVAHTRPTDVERAREAQDAVLLLLRALEDVPLGTLTAAAFLESRRPGGADSEPLTWVLSREARLNATADEDSPIQVWGVPTPPESSTPPPTA